MAQQGSPSIVAFYGTSASCVKFLLHPVDWAAAHRAPDANLWSLSAPSGTIIDKSVAIANPVMGDPGLAPGYLINANGNYLESNYAVNNPSWGKKYPGPF
jgi:hypothetical protein